MKNSKWITIGIILLFITLIAGWFYRSYNKMVTSDENCNKQWAQVQSVYQRRADLIPNLVNTVKGYASHEQETFTKVVEARSNAAKINLPEGKSPTADELKQFQAAQQEVSSALSKFMITFTVERYPDLKANQNFLTFQSQLEGTENRITVERQRFNEAVMDYNAYIRRLPANIVAGMFGFEKKAYFEAQQGSETAPVVAF